MRAHRELHLPKQRENVLMSNLNLINAILYVCCGKRLQVESAPEALRVTSSLLWVLAVQDLPRNPA